MRALLCLVALLPLCAQPQSRPVAEKPPADPAAIEGRVVDRITGAPVKKVSVRVYGPQGGNTTAITSASGRFAIRGLPPGKYHIETQHKAYPQGRLGPPRIEVDLAAGEEKSDFVVRLSPGATLTGQVLDEDGEPAPGRHLTLLEFDFQNGRKQLGYAGSGSSNDRGEYRLFHIPPGRYYLKLRSLRALLAPRPFAPRAARLDLPQEAHAAVFYPGAPTLKGAQVLDLKAGENRQGIDFRLNRTPVTTVYGQIVGPDEAWRGARLQVRLVAVADPMLGRATPTTHGSVRGASGQFRIRPMPPGSYWLYVFEGGNPVRYGAKQRVEIDGPSVDVVVRLNRARDLPGMVELDGHPKETVRAQNISLESPDPQIRMQEPRAEVADGEFVLKNVLPGEWRLRANIHGPGYLKTVWLDGREVDPSGFTLPPQSAGPLRVVLGTRLARIEGTVLTPIGEEGGWVALIPNIESVDIYNRVRTGSVPPGGRFQFPSVPPGEYRLFALPAEVPQDPYRLLRNLELIEAMEDHGEHITLIEGAVFHASPRLIRSELFDRFEVR